MSGAEKRFNQVRKLANTVLFEYHDNVAKLTGSTPLREKMVKDSLEYLNNLAGEDGNDVALQREIASAYIKIGDVQGDTTGANLGDLKGAIESYKRAFSIRDRIYRQDPNDAISIGEMGVSYNKIGYFHFGNGKFDEALSNFSSE